MTLTRPSDPAGWHARAVELQGLLASAAAVQRTGCDHAGIGRPGCATCDPRVRSAIGLQVAQLEELEDRARRAIRAIDGIREAAVLTDQEDRCRYCGVTDHLRHASDCRVRELYAAGDALEAGLEAFE